VMAFSDGMGVRVVGEWFFGGREGGK